MKKFAISIFAVVVSTMIASNVHATMVSTPVDLELQLLAIIVLITGAATAFRCETP